MARLFGSGEVDDGLWTIRFASVVLGRFDQRHRSLQPISRVHGGALRQLRWLRASRYEKKTMTNTPINCQPCRWTNLSTMSPTAQAGSKDPALHQHSGPETTSTLHPSRRVPFGEPIDFLGAHPVEISRHGLLQRARGDGESERVLRWRGR